MHLARVSSPRRHISSRRIVNLISHIHRTTSSSLLPNHSPPIRSSLPINHCSFAQTRFRIKPYDFNRTIFESRVLSSSDTSTGSPIQNLRIHGSNRFFSCFSVLQLDQVQISRRLPIQLKPSVIMW
ncbi:hypothetical protein LR48_Vigan08g055500 [Vigna angularis]|uniref:Uncharacterized protein n=1 Tax=Phaseolus angularis TaxID=3914 RepID=A0A0L9V3Y8_PHAAN|nr:hypothetical protein LR48_Vigan08g055500 [Vigna angularis]